MRLIERSTGCCSLAETSGDHRAIHEMNGAQDPHISGVTATRAEEHFSAALRGEILGAPSEYPANFHPSILSSQGHKQTD